MSLYYPVLLKIEGKRCLVVGGGKVAERKVKGLLEAGGEVKVVSPKLTRGLEALFSLGKISWQKSTFQAQDLEGVYLVIAATDDSQVNKQVADEASKRGILVNVVDSEASSSFILPSVIRRGELILAVSTSGKSPALARKLKEELEKSYSEEYGRLLDIVFRARGKLLEEDKHLPYERWRELLDGELLELVRQGKEEEAFHRLLQKASGQ